MNFNPDFLKCYTSRQLNQLSRAGGVNDAGSSSQQDQQATLTHSDIFSRVLRSSPAGSRQPLTQEADSGTTDVVLTDLDDQTNARSPTVEESSWTPMDENSRSSVSVQWDNRPEHPGQEVEEVQRIEQEVEEVQRVEQEVEEVQRIEQEVEEVQRVEQTEPTSVYALARQSYDRSSESIVRKKVAPKHLLRDPCTCKRRKCFTKFSTEARRHIWLNYWSLDGFMH